jgi:hypothetical protein
MTALLALALKGLADPRALAGLAFAAVLAFAGAQTVRLHHAKVDQLDPASHRPWRTEASDAEAALQETSADLATCRTGLAQVQGALAAQSTSVKALGDQGRADTAAASVAAAGAEDAARRAGVVADRLLAAQPGGDACASADALILKSLGGDQE